MGAIFNAIIAALVIKLARWLGFKPDEVLEMCKWEDQGNGCN
jgi:hypothetical protein